MMAGGDFGNGPAWCPEFHRHDARGADDLEALVLNFLDRCVEIIDFKADVVDAGAGESSHPLSR